jgi:hypothetical protein
VLSGRRSSIARPGAIRSQINVIEEEFLFFDLQSIQQQIGLA